MPSVPEPKTQSCTQNLHTLYLTMMCKVIQEYSPARIPEKLDIIFGVILILMSLVFLVYLMKVAVFRVGVCVCMYIHIHIYICKM